MSQSFNAFLSYFRMQKCLIIFGQNLEIPPIVSSLLSLARSNFYSFLESRQIRQNIVMLRCTFSKIIASNCSSPDPTTNFEFHIRKTFISKMNETEFVDGSGLQKFWMQWTCSPDPKTNSAFHFSTTKFELHIRKKFIAKMNKTKFGICWRIRIT